VVTVAGESGRSNATSSCRNDVAGCRHDTGSPGLHNPA
jgi:hypothetical protein